MNKILILISILFSSFFLTSCGGESTELPIPPTSTSLVASASSGTVSLSWTGSDGATYKVYQSTATIIADDLSSYTSYNVSVSSTAITGLTNGTRYYFVFVVTALANGKESPVSNEVNALPDFPIPLVPTSLTVTNASSGTVNLSWNSVAGATYKVYQSTATIGDDLSSYTSYNVTVSSADITGLTNGSSYYFVVTALANGKESLASDEVDGLPDFPIPLVPTSLTVTSISSGTVNLSWNSVAGASYKVYQSTGSIGDDLSSYTSYDVSISSRAITNLTNGRTYYFVVTALANGKESLVASNEAIGRPDFPIPPTPTSLVATPSNQEVSLRWTGSDKASSYEVHQAESSFNGINAYNQLPGYTSYNITATSRLVTGLMNGKTYYFVVTALANGRKSPASNEASATTDESLIRSPMNLMATAHMRRINLSWTDSENEAVSYKVHQAIQTFSDISADNYNTLDGYQLHEATSTSISITGLARERYYFVVMAFKSTTRESLASNEVSEIPTFELNDTGITWGGHYGSGNQGGTNCSPTGFAAGTEQDCHQGRDAKAVAGMLLKIGGGNAGFDFTKLGSTGTALSIQDAAWSSSGTESSGTKWSCVRDNVTDAVWEVKTGGAGIHNRDNTYTYNDWAALVDGSNQENNGMGLCGYNDWRVPTAVELDGIVDLGNINSRNAIDGHYFPNTEPSLFWSSSIVHLQHWVFNFNNGDSEQKNRNESHHLRLIRSSFTAINSWSDSRYTDHEDGTVTDNVTGLMWTKCSLGQSGTDCRGGRTITWGAALEQASASTLANYDDWRLPNRKELRSLLAYDRILPIINSNVFPNTSDEFWTSMPSVHYNYAATDIHFTLGFERGTNRRNSNRRTRFVRSSQ